MNIQSQVEHGIVYSDGDVFNPKEEEKETEIVAHIAETLPSPAEEIADMEVLKSSPPLIQWVKLNDNELKTTGERALMNSVIMQELWQYIYDSKGHPEAAIAARNAITALNLIRVVQFSGKDLSGINIPGANLSKGDFQNTNFTDANLENVDFRHANLVGANFTDAKQNGAIFFDKTAKRAKSSKRPLEEIDSLAAIDLEGIVSLEEIARKLFVDKPALLTNLFQMKKEKFDTSSFLAGQPALRSKLQELCAIAELDLNAGIDRILETANELETNNVTAFKRLSKEDGSNSCDLEKAGPPN